MDKQSLSERDICTKFITPSLEWASWDIQTQVREEVTLTHVYSTNGSGFVEHDRTGSVSSWPWPPAPAKTTSLSRSSGGSGHPLFSHNCKALLDKNPDLWKAGYSIFLRRYAPFSEDLLEKK